jgi:hypothetical protein
MKVAYLTAVLLQLSACSVTQQGEFKTLSNKPMVFVSASKSLTLSPGPVTAKVNYSLKRIQFENPKDHKIDIPFLKTPAADSVGRFAREGISHYARHEEVFIANLGEPFTATEERSCSAWGSCYKSETAVRCQGAVYGQDSAPEQYKQYKNNADCSSTLRTYYANGVMCDGIQIVHITKQLYSAYDSFDFFTTADDTAQAFFDSASSQRTHELAVDTGPCLIKP